MKLIFHPEAEEEYNSATEYYAARERGLDLRFVDCVDRTIRLILEDPLRWRRIDGDARRSLTPVFPFAVIYIEKGGCVYVMAVMHTSRQPGYWRSRRIW